MDKYHQVQELRLQFSEFNKQIPVEYKNKEKLRNKFDKLVYGFTIGGLGLVGLLTALQPYQEEIREFNTLMYHILSGDYPLQTPITCAGIFISPLAYTVYMGIKSFRAEKKYEQLVEKRNQVKDKLEEIVKHRVE